MRPVATHDNAHAEGSRGNPQTELALVTLLVVQGDCRGVNTEFFGVTAAPTFVVWEILACRLPCNHFGGLNRFSDILEFEFENNPGSRKGEFLKAVHTSFEIQKYKSIPRPAPPTLTPRYRGERPYITLYMPKIFEIAREFDQKRYICPFFRQKLLKFSENVIYAHRYIWSYTPVGLRALITLFLQTYQNFLIFGRFGQKNHVFLDRTKTSR